MILLIHVMDKNSYNYKININWRCLHWRCACQPSGWSAVFTVLFVGVSGNIACYFCFIPFKSLFCYCWSCFVVEPGSHGWNYTGIQRIYIFYWLEGDPAEEIIWLGNVKHSSSAQGTTFMWYIPNKKELPSDFFGFWFKTTTTTSPFFPTCY